MLANRKLLSTGTKPSAARAAATQAPFCSAMPHSIMRSNMLSVNHSISGNCISSRMASALGSFRKAALMAFPIPLPVMAGSPIATCSFHVAIFGPSFPDALHHFFAAAQVHVELFPVGHSPAFDGMSDDELGFIVAVLLGHQVECVKNLAEIVAVDLVYRPAEGLPLLDQWLDGDDVVRRPVERPLVVIHDAYEVVELELGSEHGRFPDLSLVHLTVAHD